MAASFSKRKLVGRVAKVVDQVEDKVEMEVIKKKPSDDPEPRIPAYFGIIIVAFLTFSYLYFMSVKSSKQRIWYAHELAMHNGTDEKLPLLLAVTGLVFDVTKGSTHYGKGKSYNYFCGRDASRAFATGKSNESSLTDNVSNLTYENIHSLEKWRSFYKKNYREVGVVVGRFFDSEGKPKKALENLERKFKRAEVEIAKISKDEEVFPSCSSKWSQETGGEVWCDSGVPRKVFRPSKTDGTVRSRCACIQPDDVGMPDQQEYPNCPPDAQRCVTVPP